MRFCAALLWAAVSLPASSAASDKAIDLTAREWFIAPGFAPGNAGGLPPGERRPAGAFPVVPNRIFSVPVSETYAHYTLETSFTLDAQPEVAPPQLLGLFFAAIGENWEIYVNGVRVAGDMPPEVSGEPAFRRLVRDLAVPLPPDVLRAGENRLVVHLAGDAPRTPFAWNTALGFYKRSGYRIAPYFANLTGARDLADLGLVALFFFFGAYTLVMFALRPVERAHLYFGALATVISVYYLTRTTALYPLTQDTTWVLRTEYAMLTVAAPCVIWFVHEFFEPGKPSGGFVKLFTGVSAALLLGAVAAPYAYLDVVLMLWQAFGLGGVAYVTAQLIAAIRNRNPLARRLLPGLVALTLAVGWDIVDTIWIFSNLQFSRYAFAILILNLAAMITGRTLQMRAATQAGVLRLAESAQRLRALFEAGFEAIVISAEGRIVDANPAFRRIFGFSLEQAAGRPVSELFARPAVPAMQPGAETLMRRADGTTFYAECWQLVNADGSATLVIRDVDDKLRAANELAERNHELEVLVRSMAEREKRMRELETELASRHPEKP